LKAQATVSPLAQVFGLEVRAVGGEDELRLGLGRRRLALRAASVCVTRPASQCQDVDVAGLENTAEVGLVRRPGAQALEGRRLVAKGLKEGVGELCGVKRPLREVW
jgi:hypothetical protein